MSFYTSSLKTQYLEPNVFSSRNRVEYRLNPDTLYLANMRLLNVSNNAPGAPPNYGIGCGVLQFMKTIELLDGNKKLCRLDNVDGYYNFMTVNNSNEKASSKHFLDKTGLGYAFVQESIITSGIGNAIIRQASAATPIDENGNPTRQGQIDLNSLLPFLKASRILPTSIFKNLKLSITFFSNGIATWTGANPPVLAVDEMLNTEVVDAMVAQYKGFTWNEIETDQFLVPAIDQGSLATGQTLPQSVNAQLKGFDNKVVKRCFIQKKTDGDFYNLFGPSGSAPMNEEVFQVRKNGSNLYPGNGLDSPAKIFSELVQVWGEFDKPVLGVFTAQLGAGLNGDAYLGFDLTGARTNELQVSYQRLVLKDNNANFNDRTSRAMNMNVTGEVEKQLVVSADDYMIAYS